MPGGPFVLEPLSLTPLRRAALTVVRPFLSRLLRIAALEKVYRSLSDDDASAFPDRVLAALNVHVECAPDELALVPRRGPLVVVANHPRGMLDGLVLASLLARVRPDVRLVANHLLAGVPELGRSCFFVDPFQGPCAAARSRAGLRAAHLWLRQGGAVVVFPAGAVAPARDARGAAMDDKWTLTAARLAVHTGATVLPIEISGANSTLFYFAGRVHSFLRTALLPHELLRARGSRVAVRVAPPIPVVASLSHDSEALRVTAQARQEIDRLSHDDRALPASGAETIAAEISRLPPQACLASSGQMRVYCAQAEQIPETLLEIGRLRAVAYRAAGEGTGADVDLDVFDRHYLHLFSFDGAAGCVVGAYRIAPTDAVVAAHGPDGLYTRSLFRFDERFLASLSPALELGRSFVRPEYQKNHTALLLLWKGIGTFVGRHPQYRVLFGPVSIGATYADASHVLMRRFLEQHHTDSARRAMVVPLNPPRTPAGVPVQLPRTPEEVDRLIRAAEADGKGMPVLLRQYLKLGARLIAFNVDRAFSDVVDALMMVDLGTLDSALLQRYLGRDGAATFRAHHAADHAA